MIIISYSHQFLFGWQAWRNGFYGFGVTKEEALAALWDIESI